MNYRWELSCDKDKDSEKYQVPNRGKEWSFQVYFVGDKTLCIPEEENKETMGKKSNCQHMVYSIDF